MRCGYRGYSRRYVICATRMASFIRFARQYSMGRLLVCLAVLLVAYNEFGCFVLSSWFWPRMSSSQRSDKNLRILFVADPQLVGLNNEHQILGYLTRWDSDKYLRLGFWHAVGHVRPDVVVFLGDLLDEGSTGSDEDYLTYVERFANVFKLPAHVKTIFVSGDNDVGGEGPDPKEPWKIRRFKKHFDMLSSSVGASDVNTAKFVDFFKFSLDWGDAVSQSVIDNWLSMSRQSEARYRVICNHMTLLNRSPASYRDLLNAIKPQIIFTAHTHLTRIYKCTNCFDSNPSVSQESIDGNLLTVNLNDRTQLYEVTIPTCSYRMGVERMAFGAAVVDEDGLMTFTVLWLPSRYKILASYVIFLLSVVILLLFDVLRRCSTSWITSRKQDANFVYR